MLENRMRRRIIGPISDQAAGEQRKSPNLYLHEIFQGEQIKDAVSGGTRITHGKMRKYYKILVCKSDE
jgi:hypothetical protein